MKIIEEVQELHITEHNKVHEAADLMAHLMMYFNAHNIPMTQVLNEL
jgi:phosphoribosyl-ATP pyrophosphohydrolase